MYQQEISKRIFIFFLLTVLSHNLFSQGAFSIMYLPIDSLNPSLYGKEIRLDFKSSIEDTLYSDITSLLLGKNDTIRININQENLLFVENWVIDCDNASLNDQELNCLSDLQEYKSTYIKEIFFVSTDDTSIVVDVHIYSDSSSKFDKFKVIIERSVIKGIVMRNY